MACRCCDCECAGCYTSEYVFEDGRDANGDGLTREALSLLSPPAEAVYAEGYPEALDSCLWFWWYCYNACSVVISEGPPRVSATTTLQSQRLFICRGGQLRDITDKATTNGPFVQGPFDNNGGAAGNTSVHGATPCPEGPDDNFLNPVITCA